jgi:tryptophan-rich sensory protein
MNEKVLDVKEELHHDKVLEKAPETSHTTSHTTSHDTPHDKVHNTSHDKLHDKLHENTHEKDKSHMDNHKKEDLLQKENKIKNDIVKQKKSELKKIKAEKKDSLIDKGESFLAKKFHKFEEYESIYQPEDKVFKYVWIVLYTFYAISFFSTLKYNGPRVSLGIGLGLNFFWIFCFFFFKNPVISLGVLSLQIIFGLDSIFRLFRIKKNVQAIFICIYLGWLLFAFYLNFVIVKNYYVHEHEINPEKYIKFIK